MIEVLWDSWEHKWRANSETNIRAGQDMNAMSSSYYSPVCTFDT
jgi:hypothetical protein